MSLPSKSSCLSRHRHQRLWAITAYFNPVGYKTRRENYLFFRQKLQVPLVTVEISLNNCFELGQEDADLLIQLNTRDILWQKERLLNLAVEALPDSCDQVAWVDCDVVFDDDTWSARASEMLGQYKLIQPFQYARDLARDEPYSPLKHCPEKFNIKSLLYHLDQRGPIDKTKLVGVNSGKRSLCMGFAWVAHRELLQRHGLYDAAIVGGGDRAIYCAVMGKIQTMCENWNMVGTPREQHYRDWAKPFFESVGGRYTWIPGGLTHLWHGKFQDRGYSMRHEKLSQFDFNPYSDIVLMKNGCWQWNSNKPELHRFVRDYFQSRKEDGRFPEQGK